MPLLAVALLSAGVAAHADPVTDLISVNATAETATGTTQTVDLMMSLTFDPDVNTLSPTTAGLNVLSIANNDTDYTGTYNAPVAWTYFYEPSGSLDITTTTVPGAIVGGTNSYGLDLAYNPNGTLSLVSFEEANASTPYLTSLTGNLTVTQQTAAVTPEPSSIALLGTGLLGVAGVLRRRVV